MFMSGRSLLPLRASVHCWIRLLLPTTIVRGTASAESRVSTGFPIAMARLVAMNEPCKRVCLKWIQFATTLAALSVVLIGIGSGRRLEATFYSLMSTRVGAQRQSRVDARVAEFPPAARHRHLHRQRHHTKYTARDSHLGPSHDQTAKTGFCPSLRCDRARARARRGAGRRQRAHGRQLGVFEPRQPRLAHL